MKRTTGQAVEFLQPRWAFTQRLEQALDRLLGVSLFTAFDWQRPLPTASYCELVATYSDHASLPPAQLAGLLARLAHVVDAHGGVLPLSFTTASFGQRGVVSRLSAWRPAGAVTRAKIPTAGR